MTMCLQSRLGTLGFQGLPVISGGSVFALGFQSDGDGMRDISAGRRPLGHRGSGVVTTERWQPPALSHDIAIRQSMHTPAIRTLSSLTAGPLSLQTAAGEKVTSPDDEEGTKKMLGRRRGGI